ncbi:hypothetical protein FACS1894176_06310 [Bacteroidia bacterium]|nr:hypothetical protein FACS1894176_06310 [Bacteroidia bacterium]
MTNEKDRVQYLKGAIDKVNINTYLQNGVLHYPGSATYGENGNTVVMGHSSYFTADQGRYKTIFQAIIALNQGDLIWIFEKDAQGVYKKYTYIVEKSYQT